MELSNKELGHFLRCVREQLGYSIYDVNKLCNISPSYLSLMENGKRKPSAIILKKLAPIYTLNYIDLYEKAGYLDLAESERLSHKTVSIDDFDTEELDEDDIEEIKRFIEFVKNKKKTK